MKIEDYEFEKLKNFMLSTYGMDLSKKRVLVESRLKQPASANGFTNLRDYIAAAMQQPS